MDVAALLVEIYDRIPPLAREAVEGLTREQLVARPGAEANTIAWLVWHSARVQDAQIAPLVDAKQLWVEADWAARFGLEPDPRNHGYGHTPEQVMAVQPRRPQDLLDYLDVVATRTREMLKELTPADLDRIVDREWDPPITLGVRLVSIADDCIQHVGQAAYVRGLLATS